MSHAVFISYSSKDKTIADAVCAKLEERKIHCWIAPRDIPVGQNFAKSIIYAINESKVFVLVWSAHTNTSEHILNEINQAFDQGITIIPFRIEDVQPTVEMRYYFGRTHWLDALTPPLEKHIGVLAQSINAVLESKLDISPEQIQINKEGIASKENKLDKSPQAISPKSALKNEEPLSPIKLERRTNSENQGKEQEESIKVQSPSYDALKKKKLFSVLGLLIIAAALVVMSFLGVFKGFPYLAGHKPVASPETPTQNITITPTRLTPSFTPEKRKITSTPQTTEIFVTPSPFWATEFSGQIMTAIKYREPDFFDDFSFWKTDWHMEDGTGNPECKSTYSKIMDGKLYLSSNIGCWSWARLRNLDLHNFAVQIEMDLSRIDSEGSISISGATEFEDFVLMLNHDGNWGTWYCMPEGKCKESQRGKLHSTYDTSPATITVVFNGTENAVFVNSFPLYHDNRYLPVSIARHINISVQDASKSVPQRIVEFDNLKVWDLNKIEVLSATSTIAK